MRKKPHAEQPASMPSEPQAEGAPVPGALAPSDGDTAGAPWSEAQGPVPGATASQPGGFAPIAPAAGGPAGSDERDQLRAEVAELKDRLLRTAADFDNFRKRAAREKADSWGRAQADIVQRVLEGIDDLGRVAHLDPAQTSSESLHEGVGMVERKLLKVLESVGLERVDPSGQPFDPNAHEAVMTTPAPSAEQDGAVASVFQAGYRMNGALLRPARVSVFAYVEPAPGETVH